MTARVGWWSIVPVLVVFLALVSAAGSQAATGFSGTVSGGGPDDLGEVEVCVVEAGPLEQCTFPAANGSYALLGLAPGNYQVEFLPSYRSHLVVQYYRGKTNPAEGNRVNVRSNQVTGGIDAALELGGQVTGTVTDALGANPLEEVEVCALGASSGTPVSCAHTDALGAYSLPTIPSGSYRIGFWGEGASATYAPQYYAGAASFFEATPVGVAAGATLTGIDANLAKGATVTGVVANAAGTAVSDVAVCILEASAVLPKRCTYSDGFGRYAFVGLSPGGYQVAFSPEFSEFASEEFALPEDDGYLTQYYDGVATRSQARTLTLGPGAVAAGVDAVLATPSPPPAAAPAQPSVGDVAALPSAVAPAVPNAPAPTRCKKGYAKKKVKGAVKCVKAKKKKHDKPKKGGPARRHKKSAKPTKPSHGRG